jgi:hypothetical protein
MTPHNPLTLFTSQLLAVHLQSGNRYFVRQTYERGLTNTQHITSTNPSNNPPTNTTTPKAAFLISEYADLSRAKIHMAALEQDAQAYLYDAEDPEHLRRLNIAAGQPVGYAIYAPLLAMRQWKPSDLLKAKIKTYIESKLKWKPRGSDEIGAELFLHFGELFITLKFGHDHAKVKLLEIEKH